MYAPYMIVTRVPAIDVCPIHDRNPCATRAHTALVALACVLALVLSLDLCGRYTIPLLQDLSPVNPVVVPLCFVGK